MQEFMMTKNLVNVQITVTNLPHQEFVLMKNLTNVQNVIKNFQTLAIFIYNKLYKINMSK